MAEWESEGLTAEQIAAAVERAKAAEERADKATPEPWVVEWIGDREDMDREDAIRYIVQVKEDGHYNVVVDSARTTEDDAFIASARIGVPYLAVVVQRLATEWERQRNVLKTAREALQETLCDHCKEMIADEDCNADCAQYLAVAAIDACLFQEPTS